MGELNSTAFFCKSYNIGGDFVGIKHRDSTRAWSKEKQALKNMTTSMPSKEAKKGEKPTH